jgi:hypothetical protein
MLNLRTNVAIPPNTPYTIMAITIVEENIKLLDCMLTITPCIKPFSTSSS